MDEKLLALLENVPQMEIPGTEVTEKIDSCGYPYYFVKGSRKSDLFAYLETLKNNGFEVCGLKGGLGILKPRKSVAICRKGELFVSLTQTRKGTSLSYYMDPYYKAWHAERVFQEIPSMNEVGAIVHEVTDCGSGNYMVVIERTLKEHYQRYMQTLEDSGFTKIVDNGSGLNGTVFNATYKKEQLVVSVVYIAKQNKTYIMACLDLPLSEHLFYKEEYVSANKKNAKTKLHMLEMWSLGSSFVFQLKNGHFVVSDGGLKGEAKYFLDYLEALTPKGEKPIVEGWFLSHTHPDHTGTLREIGGHSELAERIIVDGIYYNEPNDCVLAYHPGCSKAETILIKKAAKNLRTEKGNAPNIYRTQTGQRYYFNDITIDVVLGQEQLPLENYSGDINDSSTWLMFTIDGQKCLFGGDGDIGGMRFVMNVYDKKYCEVDFFTSLHHCSNTRKYFTNFCSIKTLLVTRGTEPKRRLEDNEHLKASVEEWISRIEGTRVFNFPYQVGSSEILPHFEWKYHPGENKPEY